MALSAAIQGLGVALESTTIAEPHLRDHKLYPLFPGLDWHLAVEAHFLVYPAKHEQRGLLRNFLEWLRGNALRD
jgi:LysR family glycine cleavage system transcriptional activator